MIISKEMLNKIWVTSGRPANKTPDDFFKNKKGLMTLEEILNDISIEELMFDSDETDENIFIN